MKSDPEGFGFHRDARTPCVLRRILALRVAAPLVLVLAIFATSLRQVSVLDPTKKGRKESMWIASLTNRLSEEDVRDWLSLGPDSVPILMRAIEMGEGRIATTYARVHPKLPRILKRILKEPTDYSGIRQGAYLRLSLFIGTYEVPVEPLIRAFYRASPIERNLAFSRIVKLLPHLGQEKQSVLPLLVRGIGDKDPQIRGDAALGLQYFQERADVVGPALTRALADSDQGVQLRAALSLTESHIATSPEDRMEEIATRFVKEEATAESAEIALRLLENLARTSPSALQMLVAVVNNQRNIFLRMRGIQALGRLGPTASSAAPALRKLLDDPDLWKEAEQALGRIDSKKAQEAKESKTSHLNGR